MRYALFTLLAACVFVAAFQLNAGTLKVGSQAPDFTLKDQKGNDWNLSSFLKNLANDQYGVLLYFYPKDKSPGCTAQACSLRDGYRDLQKAGITIIGVSYDSEKKHLEFIKEKHLPFDLLSDNKKQVAKKYGAAYMILGIALPFPKRVSFLINKEGVVTHVLKDIKVRDHARQIIEALASK